ncbi:MAG: retention module-containing protein, partial [Methylophilus sp.]
MAILGKVVALTGTAYIIHDNGEKRELQLGDTVELGDTIQTMSGALVELQMVDGRDINIPANQLVALTEDLASMFTADNLNDSVDLATIESVIQAIETGKDVNEVLEDTAAGASGSRNSYGFSFVGLMRIPDVLNQFSFDYGFNYPGNLSDQAITNDLIDDNLGVAATSLTAANTTAPSAPFASLVHDAVNDTGSSTVDNITNNSSPAITGTGTPGDTITLYGPGNVVLGTVLIPPSGTWTIDPPSNYLTEGPNVLTVKAIDPSGNESPDTTLDITLDTTIAAPTIALTTDSGSSNADGITNNGTLNIGNVEPGATVQYSTDGGTTWTNSFTPVEGSNTVAVRQTDTAGNTSGSSNLSFTLDTTIAAPTIALTTDSGSSNADGITNNGTLNI